MVKNELSLKLEQHYKLIRKIKDNEVTAFIQKEEGQIVNIKRKSVVISPLVEDKLLEKRKEYLLRNIDALFTTNPYAIKIEVYENNIALQKENWSYVTIDRSTHEKEHIRRRQAHNRHSNAIYEVNLQRQEFLAKRYEISHKDYVDYRIKYDDSIVEFTSDKTPLIKEHYKDFYDKLIQDYNSLQHEAKEKIDNFKEVLLSQIDRTYENGLARDVRNDIVSTSKEILSLYEQREELFKQIKDEEIDIDLLNAQQKEGFDVKEELSQHTKVLETLNQSFKDKKEEIDKLNEKLDALICKNKEAYSIVSNDIITTSNDKENEILSFVNESFALEWNLVFNRIFHKVKDYVDSMCPPFDVYFKQKEEEHEKINKEFIEDNKKNVSDSCYGTNKYLSSSTKEDNKEKLTNDHLNRKKASKEKYHNTLKAIKDGIEFRKDEYKEQKKAAKINLKNADGAKASEIKEVLKVYKKSIRTGTLKAKIKALTTYIKESIAEIFIRNNENKKANLSKPLLVKKEYEENSKIKDRKLAKEYKELTKDIDKDLKISRYKKNFTTKSRENVLGYLFLLIWAVGFLLFTLWPIIYTYLLMYTNVSFQGGAYTKLVTFSFSEGLKFPTFVGMQNFKILFLQQVTFTYTYVPQFFRSMIFYLPIVVFISFVLAMLLNSKIKGRTIFRVIYFLPVVIVSGPVINMLNSENTSGASSIRLSLAGSNVAKVIESLSPTALRYANEIFQNFIIILWMTGVPIVLFISALQKINKQLYEAAEIDGANKWQMLWTITFPLIKSIMLIVCLFTIMQITTISVSFVNPINSWIDGRLRESGTNLGLISLASWVQTIIVLLFVLVSFLIFREKEFVSKDKNYEEVQEAKAKKEKRRQRRRKFFKVDQIKNFFARLFGPLIKMANARRQRKEEKERNGG